MIIRVRNIGLDEPYGEERTIVDDDQVGRITVREMEIDSFDDVQSIVRDGYTVTIEKTLWDRYAAEVTITTPDL